MTSVAGVPRIESLEEYEIPMKEEIRIYLKDMYARHYISLMGVDKESTFAVTEEQRRLGHEMAVAHLERFLHRMKQAPRQTTLRSTSTKYHNQRNVGDCDSIMERVQDIMTEWAKSTGATGFITPIVQTHNKLDELTTVDIKMTKATDDERKEDKSLYRCRVPHLQRYPTIFPDWPTREMHGWPDTHRVVVVDRFCGEAVLRGADIFVKGIVVADTGIRSEENVAVYAHVGKDSVSRGMVLQHYMGHCVFLGIGRSLCDRSRFFSQSTGLGIRMSALPYERAGPVLPPLSPLLEVGDLYAQNLPSIYVGKVLDPKPGDCIYDMCGAPGGKTSHLALLTNGQATIVMSDKSRSKVIAARTLFDELGCGESVYPLHVDATKCVESNSTNACDPNMKDVSLGISIISTLAFSCLNLAVIQTTQILHRSRRSESDGLLDVSSFPPESFDKILLDPPCSALGLRPKLR